MKLIVFFILFFVFFSSFGQSRILIDDDFSDWENINTVYVDPAGDNGFSFVDFGALKIYNDSDFLFFNIEVGNEINLQDANGVTIYIDTDNADTTGFLINGIGADLQYSFGDRTGLVMIENNTFQIYHDDIQLVTAPTVTSNQFEIVLNRNLNFSGQNLFQGDSIKIIFKDNSGNWDVLPDSPESVVYTFIEEATDPLPEFSIQKTDSELLRVLSYNVLSNGLFDFQQAPPMERLIKAINPEIIGFQEIYNHESVDVANKVESILPSGPDDQWYHAKHGPDIIAISKYPIINSFEIENNGAFLLDLKSEYGSELLFIVAHPPCCDNNFARQLEIDAIMSFVRNAQNGIGPLQLEENTPIIIAGDMNLVGYRQQLITFLTGDIDNENFYGPDFIPDWDNTDLDDSRPYTTGMPNNFTWFDEGSSFSPGRLDFIFFTGSVLELSNNYTLFTRTLTQDTLDAYNLLAEDAIAASDHLPVVSDFYFNNVTGLENFSDNESHGIELFQNQPNPFDQNTFIQYRLTEKSFVDLSIYNNHGGKVAHLVNETQNAGTYKFKFDAAHLNEGIYFIKIQSDTHSRTKKMMIVR